MLTKDTIIFLQFPHESRTRLLHQGMVLDISPGAFQAIFEEESLPLQPGQELLIYFMQQRKFLKQSARVLVIHRDVAVPIAEDEDSESSMTAVSCATGLVAALEPIGQPVSAESRQSYRVSTVISERSAELNGEMCKLMDVSATGFAVVAMRQYKVGQVLDSAVTLGGETFRGKVCIQSVRDAGGGGFRYGLHCADSRNQCGGLKDGLPKLTMALQIEQLRRRSGAA